MATGTDLRERLHFSGPGEQRRKALSGIAPEMQKALSAVREQFDRRVGQSQGQSQKLRKNVDSFLSGIRAA